MGVGERTPVDTAVVIIHQLTEISWSEQWESKDGDESE